MCGTPACSKSTGPIVPTLFAYFGSLSHFGYSCNISNFSIILLFVRQRERPGLPSQVVAWPPRLSAGRRESGFMGSQRVGHDWVTELNWTELKEVFLSQGPFLCGQVETPRDKETSQHVLNLSHYVGIAFAVQTQCVLLCCLSMCLIWHLPNPTTISIPCQGETGYFCCRTRRIPAS